MSVGHLRLVGQVIEDISSAAITAGEKIQNLLVLRRIQRPFFCHADGRSDLLAYYRVIQVVGLRPEIVLAAKPSTDHWDTPLRRAIWHPGEITKDQQRRRRQRRTQNPIRWLRQTLNRFENN